MIPHIIQLDEIAPHFNLKDMIDNNNYLIKVRCKNCDINYEMSIPKGTKYEDVECKNCGLKNLVKQMPNSFEPGSGTYV